MTEGQLELIHRAYRAASFELEHIYQIHADRITEARRVYEECKKSADNDMQLHRKDVEAKFLNNIKEGE
jgi:hypothetical protein